MAFAFRHPLLTLTALLTAVVWIAAGSLLHITGTAQGCVALSVPVFVFGTYMFGRFGYGAVYIVIAMHPITGRPVCAYVGLTTQKPYTDSRGVVHYPRIEQHLLGSDYYGKGAKVWADTVLRWYFAHESYYMPGVRKRKGQRGEAGPVLRFLEFVHIKWRRPLYNWIHNGENGRQIPEWVAEAQRLERNAGIMTAAYMDALTKLETRGIR